MILDYIDNLELTDDEVGKHHDAVMALARLGEGLSWIYQQVSATEDQVRREAAKDNVQIAIVGGVLNHIPTGLLSCAFQWYAVSACNYAQLVGWLATLDSSWAKEYVTKVMPRLKKYRNKVAAHFALTTPSQDNEADLAASVMTHVIYVGSRLCAAALTPILPGATQEIHVSKDLAWSVTLAHERLVPRYWPSGPPKSSQSLRVPAQTTINLDVSWANLLGNGT